MHIDLFYSLSSPWAYFAGPRLYAMVDKYRATLTFKPYDFQAVVPRTGGVPLRTRPEPRIRYHEEELARWRDFLGMPLNVKPKHYPWVVTDPDWNKRPGWLVIAAQEQGTEMGQQANEHNRQSVRTLSHALLRALWAEERDTALATERIAIADACGLDGAALQALENAPSTQARYRQYTEEAVQLGIFGAPTFVIEGERFWGQDRLDFVERRLSGA
jgi:2-hydroxychromene-2-carboxylate isomerase